MGMDRIQLSVSRADGPVGAVAFPAAEFGGWTVHADENNVDTGHHGQAVGESPGFTQDVVHDDVVACPGHTGDSAVETGAGVAEDRCETARIQFVGPGFRPHGTEHIDAHVEEGAFEVAQQSARDGGLSGARDSVEKNDPARGRLARTTGAGQIRHEYMVTARRRLSGALRSAAGPPG